MNTKINLIEKNDKLVLLSPNNIGRATGLGLALLRSGEFPENTELRDMDGTKWKIPLFYKFTLPQQSGDPKVLLVGPDVFLDNQTLTIYKVRAFFDSNGNIRTRLNRMQLADIEDCILKIHQEFEVDPEKAVRVQFLKNIKDKSPYDMIVNAQGKTKFIKRWKW